MAGVGVRDPIRSESRAFPVGMLVALALALWAGPAVGQSVQGVVVDAQTGRPVPGAVLSLMGPDLTRHDTITSDRNGQFKLTASIPGTYVIAAARDAYASVVSDGITIEAHTTVSYRFELAPLSLRNMEQIAEALERNARLRSGVIELCKGRMNPEKGGILLGVVREYGTGDLLSGAIARFVPPEGDRTVEISTAVTDRYGTYVFCFVPAGTDVGVSVGASGFGDSFQSVEIRSGTISWYDFRLKR